MTRTISSTARSRRIAQAGLWTALSIALLAGTASTTAGVLVAASPEQASVQGEETLGNGWGGR